VICFKKIEQHKLEQHFGYRLFLNDDQVQEKTGYEQKC